MTPPLSEAFGHLLKRDWKARMADQPLALPAFLKERYPWIPEELQEFFGGIEEASHADEKVWLLTTNDFAGKSEWAFKWNEWETLSLDSADGDLEWVSRITKFWDAHLPVALSVADGYAYYALKQDLTVVYGREPEFEEASPFAPNFESFLRLLADSPGSP